MLRSRAQRGISKHEGHRKSAIATRSAAPLAFETAASPPPQAEGGPEVTSCRPGSRLSRACRHRAQNGAPRRALGRDTSALPLMRLAAVGGTPSATFPFTLSNSAVFFVPAARCCARVLLFSFPSTPMRGERSAERRSISVVARFGARRSALVEARRVPRRRDARLSALHRGDFRSGAALPSPAFLPDLCSELLAARSLCLAGGVPDLPGPWLRAAAAGRHSPLRLRLVSGDGPQMSEDVCIMP
jgi:hypothetical protein